MFVGLLNTIFISSLDHIRPKNRLYLTLRLIVTYLAYFDLTQEINPNSFICFLERGSQLFVRRLIFCTRN